MKKLKAILSGKMGKAVAEAKEKRIKAQLALAKANKEEDLQTAKDLVDSLYLKLGEELSPEDSKCVIEELIDAKFAVSDAQEVLEVLEEVMKDLESEVSVD